MSYLAANLHSESGLADVGYLFYDSGGVAIGARVTADIVDEGDGYYSSDSVTIPGTAKEVRWDSTAQLAAGLTAARAFLVDFPTSGSSSSGSGSFTDADRTTLLSIDGKIVAGSAVTVVSPVSVGGTTVTITHGDDYLAADSRGLDFSNPAWPVLTGGTVLMKLSNGTTFTGSVTGATALRVELTAAQTSLLYGRCRFDIEATLSNGHVTTLVLSGLLIINTDVN